MGQDDPRLRVRQSAVITRHFWQSRGIFDGRAEGGKNNRSKIILETTTKSTQLRLNQGTIAHSSEVLPLAQLLHLSS